MTPSELIMPLELPKTTPIAIMEDNYEFLLDDHVSQSVFNMHL